MFGNVKLTAKLQVFIKVEKLPLQSIFFIFAAL